MAQFSGAIQGVVSDSSDAVVAGVAVKVTNVDTGIARTAETSADGLYRSLSLAPGTYRVTVRKPGFADAVRDAVALNTGQTLRTDFMLPVSTRADQVTVEAQPPLVDTEQGAISGRINQLEVNEIPLNGNNVFNLLALQPGITGRSRSSASGGGGRSGNDPFSGEAGPTVLRKWAATGSQQLHHGWQQHQLVGEPGLYQLDAGGGSGVGSAGDGQQCLGSRRPQRRSSD